MDLTEFTLSSLEVENLFEEIISKEIDALKKSKEVTNLRKLAPRDSIVKIMINSACKHINQRSKKVCKICKPAVCSHETFSKFCGECKSKLKSSRKSVFPRISEDKDYIDSTEYEEDDYQPILKKRKQPKFRSMGKNDSKLLCEHQITKRYCSKCSPISKK